MTLKVCQFYYEDNLSQKEISAKLGISRPQISRILSSARKNNIVSIQINNPFTDETELEKRLLDEFGISDALVINTDGAVCSDKPDVFSKEAARYLPNYLFDGNRIGIMSGKTLSNVVRFWENNERKNLLFLPLIGGIGTKLIDCHANTIAANFARKTDGTYEILNTPCTVQSEHACELLMKEPSIGGLIKKAARCDVALLGIGQINSGSTTVHAGALSEKDISGLKKLGAAAAICGSYIDSDGKILDAPINRKTIGVPIKDLKHSRKIGIAIGTDKSGAIRAVLKGGLIDVLLTDTETARSVLEINSR